MVQNEKDMLPLWLGYYADQVGVENLVVLDHGSTDGSTDRLPCTVHRLPPEPWKAGWGRARLQLVNNLAHALLSCYDVVIHTDVDEFLVPDPDRHDGLRDYVLARADRRVMAPVALNVLHNSRAEAALDTTRPLLEQRAFAKFAPVMCKPLLKRVPKPWLMAFHGIQAPYEIDRDLWMFHLKYYDEGVLQAVAAQRHQSHQTLGRGAAVSAWALPSHDLVSRLRSWTEPPDPTDVPIFDSADVDLSKVVKRSPDGRFRSTGTQLRAMEKQPLRRIPQRFRRLL